VNLKSASYFYQSLIYRKVKTAFDYDFVRTWFCAQIGLSNVFVFPKRQNSRNVHLLITN